MKEISKAIMFELKSCKELSDTFWSALHEMFAIQCEVMEQLTSAGILLKIQKPLIKFTSIFAKILMSSYLTEDHDTQQSSLACVLQMGFHPCSTTG